MKRLVTPFFILMLLLLAACGGATGGNGGGGGGGNGGGQTNKGLSGGNSYTACPSGASTATAASPESGTVTLTVSGWTSTPAEDALVQQQLQNFMTANPDIKVNWSPITGDYPTKMRANIAGGNVADVFYLQPPMAPEYIKNNKLLNLSPYMARDNVKADDYYSSLVTPFSCKDGQVFGLPKDWDSLGVFYNKDLFQAAGVATPTANWTWNDFRDAAKKLTKSGNAATSQYGITLPADASRYLAFLFAEGGTVLNQDGTQAAFNSQQGVDALNYYASFQTQDKSSVLPSAVGAGWPGDAFGKGRAAMALEGGWMIPFLKESYPNVKYDIAPVPVSPNGKRADLIFTNAWSGYAGTKHPDAAWKLIKYMTGSTVEKNMLEAGFAQPSLKSLANDPYFTSNPGFKVLFDAAQYGYADMYGPSDAYIHQELGVAVQAVLLGKSDAKAALDDAANKVNAQLVA